MKKLKVKSPKSQNYDEDSIKVNEGLAGVRLNASMYLGELGAPMVYRMVKEVVDNFTDECQAGRNTGGIISFSLKNNRYVVADFAQGIPVGIKKLEDGKKLSTLTIVMTKLHAGGKFDASAYKTSGGTHGVGVSAVNGLSEKFNVWTKREGQWYTQSFEEGKPTTEVLKLKTDKDIIKTFPWLKSCAKKLGTIVEFYPDQTIISVDAHRTDSKKKNYEKALLDWKFAGTWLQNVAMLNPGVEITFHDIDKDRQKTFLNKKGLMSLVDKVIEQHEFTPLNAKGKFEVIADNLIIAAQWTNHHDKDHFLSFVNSSPTTEHGTHVKGFRDALMEALKPFFPKKKMKDFKVDDLLTGCICLMNWKMNSAAFSGQVKDKLVSKVDTDVYNVLIKPMTEFFNKNKALAKSIIKTAETAGAVRQELQNVMRAMTDVKKSSRNMLPTSLFEAPNCKPEDRELYVVEGDSAGGCFIASTPILLADNTVITYGEMVERTKLGEIFVGKSFNIETQQFFNQEFDEPRLIKHVDELIEVELSDGTIWQCTPDHPWLVGTDYIAAEDLVEDDPLTVSMTVYKALTVNLVRRIKLDSPVPVYDATMPDQNNYCLGNGVVVHNTAKNARNINQEVLKLSGKIPNALNFTLPKLLANQRIQDIIISLGADPKSLDPKKENPTFSCDNLRVARLMLLSDADPDGSHINCLLIALIWRLFPDLILQGRLYAVDAPLYNALHNGKHYGGHSIEECFAAMDKDKVPRNLMFRAKGWGEVDAKLLDPMAFDPSTRKLIRIIADTDKKRVTFYKAFVGEDSSARRQILGLKG